MTHAMTPDGRSVTVTGGKCGGADATYIRDDETGECLVCVEQGDGSAVCVWEHDLRKIQATFAHVEPIMPPGVTP